jgi:hypothetical protein
LIVLIYDVVSVMDGERVEQMEWSVPKEEKAIDIRHEILGLLDKNDFSAAELARAIGEGVHITSKAGLAEKSAWHHLR